MSFHLNKNVCCKVWIILFKSIWTKTKITKFLPRTCVSMLNSFFFLHVFKHVRKHIADINLRYSFFNACHLSIVWESWVTMVSNIASVLLSCEIITGEHDVCCKTLIDIFEVSLLSCTCVSLIAEYEVSVIFWSCDTTWDVSASSFRFWSCKLCNLCLGNLQ